MTKSAIRWSTVGILAVGVALFADAAGYAAQDHTEIVSRRQLALMPLPKSEFGPRATRLPLAQDSGVVTNGEAASAFRNGISALQLTRLGRSTGYTLDYGSAEPNVAGLSEAQTTVELYPSAAAAASGLAFWRAEATSLAPPYGARTSQPAKRFNDTALDPPGLGASQGSKLNDLPSLFATTIVFQSGALVGEVRILAADLALSHSVGLAAASALERRIHGVLAGRINGPPVGLPPPPKAAPPSHGPSLEAVALTPADLGAGRVTYQGYQVDTTFYPVAQYERDMTPAGSLASLQEIVLLFRNPGQARYEIDVLRNVLLTSQGWRDVGSLANGVTAFLHPVSVHAFVKGDESQTLMGIGHLPGGRRFSLGFVLLRVGNSVEFLTFATTFGVYLSPSGLAQIAAEAADQANHGLHRATGAVTPLVA